jgi:hypothetical protein
MECSRLSIDVESCYCMFLLDMDTVLILPFRSDSSILPDSRTVLMLHLIHCQDRSMTLDMSCTSIAVLSHYKFLPHSHMVLMCQLDSMILTDMFLLLLYDPYTHL